MIPQIIASVLGLLFYAAIIVLVIKVCRSIFAIEKRMDEIVELLKKPEDKVISQE